MRLLIDFLPIAAFLLVYFYAPALLGGIEPFLSSEAFTYLKEMPKIALATAVLIPLTGLQVVVTYLLWKKVEKMHVISFALVLIFGGLTVVLKDKTFIQWKPTLLNWLFAIAFLASHKIGNKPLIERMMSANIHLPKPLWIKLSYAWIAFFVVAGLANIIVAFSFSEAVWVKFKFFGMLGLTFAFIIAQGLFLAPHIQDAQKQKDTQN